MDDEKTIIETPEERTRRIMGRVERETLNPLDQVARQHERVTAAQHALITSVHDMLLSCGPETQVSENVRVHLEHLAVLVFAEQNERRLLETMFGNN